MARVLISDGHVCRTAIAALQHLRIEPEVGPAPGAFAPLVHTLCEDLLLGEAASGSMMCSVDDETLASLLVEVEEPAERPLHAA